MNRWAIFGRPLRGLKAKKGLTLRGPLVYRALETQAAANSNGPLRLPHTRRLAFDFRFIFNPMIDPPSGSLSVLPSGGGIDLPKQS